MFIKSKSFCWQYLNYAQQTTCLNKNFRPKTLASFLSFLGFLFKIGF